jgi:hypothetical protein
LRSLCSNRSSADEWSRKKYKVEDFQTKMNKSRGKIIQFLAESLNEQVLEQHQNTYELLEDSFKYMVECQQTG